MYGTIDKDLYAYPHEEVRCSYTHHYTKDKLTIDISLSGEEIESYFRVREFCYKNDLSIEDFPTGPDVYDGISDIAVIKADGEVIGGFRLINSSRNSRNILALEQHKPILMSIFPALKLGEKNYCEMSRLAIMPNYRSLNMLKRILRFVITFSQMNCIEYLFAIAPYSQARCYRKIFRSMGYSFHLLEKTHIHKDNMYQNLEKVTLSVMPFNKNEILQVDSCGNLKLEAQSDHKIGEVA